MYKKNFIKLLSLVSIMSLFTFTGCGKEISKENKSVLAYTEDSFTLPEGTKQVWDVQYLGEDVYSLNIGKEEYKPKYKLITSKGKLITEDTFSYVEDTHLEPTLSFSNNHSISVKHNSKYKLINKKGEFVSEPYDSIIYLGGDVYRVKKNNQHGYINSQGENIAKLINGPLDYSYDFNFLTYKNEKGKYGFINSKGKTIFPCEFDEVKSVYAYPKLVPVSKNNKWGFIDKKGNKIKDFIFDDVAMFSEGLISVQQKGKWGFMDDKGTIITPCKFDYPQLFSEGFAVVSLNSKDGVIDKNGKSIIPPQYISISDFIDGLAMAKSEYKSGIIDTKGDYVIKPNINFNGFWWDDKNIILCSYIDKTQTAQLADRKGNIISNEKFENIYYFQKDLALVSRNNKFGFINRKGQIVIPIEFDNKDNIMNFIDNLCIVYKEGKYGLVDTKGNYTIPLKYNEIKYIAKNHYAVKLNNKWGIVNTEGKIIKPTEYDEAISITSSEDCKLRVFLRKGNKGLFLSFKK